MLPVGPTRPRQLVSNRHGVWVSAKLVPRQAELHRLLRLDLEPREVVINAMALHRFRVDLREEHFLPSVIVKYVLALPVGAGSRYELYCFVCDPSS